MQKLDDDGNINDFETRSVFVSYISDWFSKKHFEKKKHVK